MRKSRLASITMVAFLVMVSVTGCAQPSQESSAGEQAGVSEIEIFMGEFFFQMEGRAQGVPAELEVGRKYELEFINMGSELHEVVIGRELVMENGQPTGYRRNLLEDVTVEIEGSTVVGDKVRKFEVEAGSVKELELEPSVLLEIEFTLPENTVGEWEMACFAPGHYQSGMRIPIVVKSLK